MKKKNAKIGRSFIMISRGETILEVIIAVTLFMIIMGPASALYISSTRTIGMNRNDLIAASLAEEGIEMLRNMRDTNFLRFSQKATECWNTKPEHNDLANCEISSNKIGDENTTDAKRFRLIIDPNIEAWTLEGPTPPESQLSDPDFSVAAAGNVEQYRLFELSGVSSDYFIPPAVWSAPSAIVPSLFYRQIIIQYLDLDGDGTPEPRMKVESLVQYRSGPSVRNVKRISGLTPFQP